MKISGQLYSDMVVSAANSLGNHKEEINNLNVFPVPDGDTGINMSLTMSECRNELKDFDGSVAECAERVGNIMLRGARGNSGVILSVFFRGLAKGLAGLDEASISDFAAAMNRGVEDAYKAVMTPTEGTILTVMRVCAEKAGETVQNDGDDAVLFFRNMLFTAVDTLNKTPEMLPALKEANVVDSGGQGFVCVLEGMLACLEGSPVEAKIEEGDSISKAADFSSFDTSDIRYPYCTECIVTKSDKYFGEGKSERLHKFAMSIGDSVVFIESSDLIKLHVHTENPGKVLTEALKFGSLYTVKIENMRNQHSALSGGAQQKRISEPVKPFGFVAVAMGEGIRAAFADLGADEVVYGGQTMNPSTDDIIDAVRSVGAKNVFVLPNNKNIYMVAKQAEELVSDRKVIVIPTRSIPQGITAMMSFDEDADAKTNEKAMNDAIETVRSLSVTYAVRDSVVGDNEITEGSILGMFEGKIACVGDDDIECINSLADRIKDASIVTVFYGEDVNEEQAAKAVETLKAKLDRFCEVITVNGGQPLYHYIISAE